MRRQTVTYPAFTLQEKWEVLAKRIEEKVYENAKENIILKDNKENVILFGYNTSELEYKSTMYIHFNKDTNNTYNNTHNAYRRIMLEESKWGSVDHITANSKKELIEKICYYAYHNDKCAYEKAKVYLVENLITETAYKLDADFSNIKEYKKRK